MFVKILVYVFSLKPFAWKTGIISMTSATVTSPVQRHGWMLTITARQRLGPNLLQLKTERRTGKEILIIWLNWSALKRSFLIDCLSGPNFPIRTAKRDVLKKM